MKEWIRRAMFEAPWWAVFINPHYLPRRSLWLAMRRASVQLRGRILDVGCGVQPYRALMTAAESVIGLELDTEQSRVRKNADAYYDGRSIPFESASFDGVVCNQVLEHVFEPEQFIREIGRVLAPSGTLVLSVPFVWPEHEQPWDSQRYSSFGLKALLQRNGFHVLDHKKLVTGGAAICALVADWVNGKARRAPLPLRLTIRLVAACPLSLVGIFLTKVGSSDSEEFYLDNFVVAQKGRVQEGK